MKRVFIIFLSIIMLASILTLVSCGGAKKDPWSDAIYTEDTSFGSGAKTIQVQVVVGENSVTFTLKTDKTTLGDALVEHKLVEGEEGKYGLYVTTVNGVVADYDVDQSYWEFYENGELLMSGADGEAISGGEHYEIVYTR